MNKCVNCDNDALYSYVLNSAFKIDYCQYHLPRFLTTQRDSGQLALVQDETPAVEEAPKKSSKKATSVDTTVDTPTDTEPTQDATNS